MEDNKVATMLGDIVMTTGATANEIAKELKKVGVQKVELWILARTLI